MTTKFTILVLNILDAVQKALAPRWVKDSIFLLMIIFFLFHLHIFSGHFYYPQGIHIWRQSDGLAQIMNYYNNDLNFMDWGLSFNQFNNGGRGVAEFPIHYVIQAGLWKIFGVNYWIPQIYTTVLTVFGLFCFYRASALIIKDYWFSLMITALYFFSPLFNAYGFRVMPDAYAIASLNIAFYMTTLFVYKKKNIWFWLAFAAILLTGLVKIFYIIPYIAFLVVMFWDFLNKKSMPFKLWQIIVFTIPLLLSYLWIMKMQTYNESVGSGHFLSGSLPYWDANSEEKELIWRVIKDEWVYQFINFLFLKITIVFGFASILLLSFIREYKWILFLILCILGLIGFDMLIYRQLLSHDYYFMTHLFLVFAIWITFFKSFMVATPGNFFVKFISVLVFIGMVFQYATIHDQYEWRYTSWRNEGPKFTNLIENRDQVANFIGDEKVIIPEDFSPNYALSILQKSGWSGYQINNYKQSYDKMVTSGAKYIILYNSDTLSAFFDTHHPVLAEEFGTVKIFKIQD